MATVVVDNIKKRYGDITALKQTSFEVEKGTLFGVIGPDGAGKTTMFRILATLLIPDSGKALIDDQDVVEDFLEVRKITGYMPGTFSLYEDLTVEENLEFFATIFDTTIQAHYHLIRDIYRQIEPFKDRLAGKLSGGMKQKLALSCALIHKPHILILDEPTTGVDAVSRQEFWDMLIKLKNRGITILVSTPYMDEAGLCDRVALIQGGGIMKIDTPDGVLRDFPHRIWAVKAAEPYRLLQDLRKYKGLAKIYPFGDSMHITSQSNKLVTDDLYEHLKSRGHSGIEIVESSPTIEDCFMDLMQQ